MILGGLKQGVTPARHGARLRDVRHRRQPRLQPQLGAPNQGPTGIAEIHCYVVTCNGKHDLIDQPTYRRIIPASIAQTVHDILAGVVAVRYRHRGRDLRCRRRRQDRHDHQLRRRLVRRLDSPDHHRGLGGLPDQARLDGHHVQRRPGRGRYLSGRHLAELHDPGTADPGRLRAPGRAKRRAPPPAAPQVRARAPAAVPARRARGGLSGSNAPTGDTSGAGAAAGGGGWHHRGRRRCDRRRRRCGTGGGGGGTGGGGGGAGGGGTPVAAAVLQGRWRWRWRSRWRWRFQWHRRGRNQRSLTGVRPCGAPSSLISRARRETKGLPVTEKRQGRSTALVIPIRRSTLTGNLFPGRAAERKS